MMHNYDQNKISERNACKPVKYRLQGGARTAINSIRAFMILTLLVCFVATVLRVMYYRIGWYEMDHLFSWAFAIVAGIIFLVILAFSFFIKGERGVIWWILVASIFSAPTALITIRLLLSTLKFVF